LKFKYSGVQRRIEPDVCMSTVQEEAAAGRQTQEIRYFGRLLKHVKRVEWGEEISCRRILTSPNVPTVRVSLWLVPQPVDWLASQSADGNTHNGIRWTSNELLTMEFTGVDLSLF
jgi:hypothetical protein